MENEIEQQIIVVSNKNKLRRRSFGNLNLSLHDFLMFEKTLEGTKT